MQKHITDGQIMRIAAKGESYIKLGETPAAAIKRYMAARKRERNTVKRVFPNTPKALESTHAYVHAYYVANSLTATLPDDGIAGLFEPLSTKPTTWPEGDAVTYEEIQ